MSVLVVDDQAVNRVVIGALLRSLNLDVIEATNGREGLLAYLRHGRDRIAFVFLDLVMPVWDGFRAALSIRSAESQRGWQQVPIVAYTSEDVQQGSPMFDKCMRSGFNDVVPKPMNRRDATQLLSRWLPGVSGHPLCSGSSSRSAASSDDEARCSCSQPGCSLCRGMTSTAAARSTGCAAAPDRGGGSSGSSADGSGSASQMGSAEGGSGSEGTGGGRSNATSERRWLPCWPAGREASG